MSEILPAGIEQQLLFPYVDITDKDASVLEYLLADQSLLHDLHVGAERESQVYQYTHAAITRTAGREYEQVLRRSAVDHGASSFEAISGFINAPGGDSDKIYLVIRKFFQATSHSRYFEESNDAYERFRTDLPNTAEVIVAASRRKFAHLAEYAVIGAALTRQFELDSFIIAASE